MERGNLRTGRGGVSLVIMAISIVVILGMSALAIDLGMLLRTRAEAQRAADAAALGGASAFVDYPPVVNPTAEADTRARYIASQNSLVGLPIDPVNEVVQVTVCQSVSDPDPCPAVMTNRHGGAVPPGTQRVLVRVRREAVPTVFAKVFGVSSLPIGAKAVAEVGPAGAAKCVMPIFAPDLWDDLDDDTNGNLWPDEYDPPAKGWEWECEGVETLSCAGAAYELADPKTGTGTGLGSDFRNGELHPIDNQTYTRDVGRPIRIWPGEFVPSINNLWCPGDPEANCGGNDIRDLIRDPCSVPPSQIGVAYSNKTGVNNGPVLQAFEDRLDMVDPTGATWNQAERKVTVTSGDWRNSPRVLLIPLMSPSYLGEGSGQHDYKFSNFAWFWIDDVKQQNKGGLIVRFLGLAGGGLGGGNTTSPLLKAIRLVESAAQ